MMKKAVGTFFFSLLALLAIIVYSAHGPMPQEKGEIFLGFIMVVACVTTLLSLVAIVDKILNRNKNNEHAINKDDRRESTSQTLP